MLYNISSWNKLFFVWPDINFFPASSRQEAESSWRDFEKIMSLVVSPVISLVGVLGNSTNIVILIRGKLTKSSICLILALAVIDTLNLLSTNNIAIHLYARGRRFGFDYPEPQARALFYVYKAQQTIEMSSKVASMLVPCLITLDRLVAVLAPYRYTRIMTVRRVSIAIFALILLSSFFGFLVFSKYDFLYISYPSVSTNEKDEENISNNTFSGIIVKSDFYLTHEDQCRKMFQITSITYGPISLGVVVIGCLVVGIQVKIQASKRTLLLAIPNKSIENKTHTTRPHNNSSNTNKSHANKSHAKKPLANKTYTKDVTNRFQEHTFQASKFCLKFVQCLECVSSCPIKTKHINLHDQLGHACDTKSATAYIHVKKEKLRFRKECQTMCSLYQENNISFATSNTNRNNTFFQAFVSGLTGDYPQNHDSRLKRDNSQALNSGLTRDHSLSHNAGLTRNDSKTHDSGLTRNNVQSRVSRLRQNKTTKTLLSVCGVYSLANTLDYVMLSYLNHAIVNIDLAIGLETTRKFVLVFNSACNFVFYVGLNRNFKESYRKLFGLCCPCRWNRI
ncbi:G-protein coupled receptor [Biomphalaria glabrata]|nr:G-protein coupled receptor [Biomphalaria glabrata]